MVPRNSSEGAIRCFSLSYGWNGNEFRSCSFRSHGFVRRTTYVAKFTMAEDKEDKHDFSNHLLNREVVILAQKEARRNRVNMIDKFSVDVNTPAQRRWLKLKAYSRSVTRMGPRDYQGYIVADRIIAERVIPKYKVGEGPVRR